jgi:hypothetical protein
MLTVILKLHRKTYSLSKDFLLTSLPQCLLSEALRGDPSVTEITITHPDVKPKAMEILVNFTLGKEPKKHHTEIILAHRYLNIPQLLIYADPLYIGGNKKLNMKNSNHIGRWRTAIREDNAVVMKYYLQKGWKILVRDLGKVLQLCRPKALQVILDSDQMDMKEYGQEALLIAITADRYEPDLDAAPLVKLLLEDKRIDPTPYRDVIINTAIDPNIGYKHPASLATIRVLMADPRINPPNGPRYRYYSRL